jgi:hypothetical protein
VVSATYPHEVSSNTAIKRPATIFAFHFNNQGDEAA